MLLPSVDVIDTIGFLLFSLILVNVHSFHLRDTLRPAKPGEYLLLFIFCLSTMCQ